MSPRMMRVFSRVHAWIYRWTGGRWGARTAHGYPVLLLTTRGRRTGRERVTPLVYHRSGDTFLVCGGSGGSASDPAWVKNLRVDAGVGVQVGTQRFRARARELAGAERERCWEEMRVAVPLIDRYRAAVARQVPLIALEPALPPGT